MSTPPTTNGRRSGAAQPAAGGRRAAALDRGRAVGPRRDPALRPHALRVRHRGGPEGRGLLPRAPPRRSTSRCSRSSRRASRSTSLTVTEHLRSRGQLDEAGGAGGDRRAHRGGPRGRQPAPLRADRPRPRAPAPPARRRPTRSRPRVHGHEAPPRELVERAERAMLEVAHDDRQKDFRQVGEVLHDEVAQVAGALRRGPLAHRHPVGLRRPRRDHRRLPARQPDHHRRAPLDGQVGARHQHRRERRAEQGQPAPGRPVQPRDVRGRARAALHRLAGLDQGRRPAQGPAAATRRSGSASCAPRASTTRRRCTSTTPRTSGSSTSAPRRGGCTSRPWPSTAASG